MSRSQPTLEHDLHERTRTAMLWLPWLRRANRKESPRLRAWRDAWKAAVDEPTDAQLQSLRATLASMDLDPDESEIEHEMLDGLESLLELAQTLARGGPAAVPTGHRAAGSEPCFLSAPATLPDVPSQPAGTLLITGTRGIFIGGGTSRTIPWQSVRVCQRQDRDVLIVPSDPEDVHRLRCNTYRDALRAAWLVKHFTARRRV